MLDVSHVGAGATERRTVYFHVGVFVLPVFKKCQPEAAMRVPCKEGESRPLAGRTPTEVYERALRIPDRGLRERDVLA